MVRMASPTANTTAWFRYSFKIADTCSETIPKVLFPFDSIQNSFSKKRTGQFNRHNSTVRDRRVHRERFEDRGQSRPLSHRGKSRSCGNKKGWYTRAELPILSVRNRPISYRN